MLSLKYSNYPILIEKFEFRIKFEIRILKRGKKNIIIIIPYPLHAQQSDQWNRFKQDIAVNILSLIYKLEIFHWLVDLRKKFYINSHTHTYTFEYMQHFILRERRKFTFSKSWTNSRTKPMLAFDWFESWIETVNAMATLLNGLC